MINSLVLENVRLFSGEGWKFDLPPLTVFCGTNSAGKSTILKSILLLRQSQGIQEGDTVSSGKLRFVGSQVDMGGYESFVTKKSSQTDLSISLTIEDQMPLFYYNILSEGKNKSLFGKKVKSDNIELLPYLMTLKFTFCSAKKGIDEQVLLLSSIIEEDNYMDARGKLTNIECSLIVKENEILKWEVAGRKNRKNDKELEYFIRFPRKLQQHLDFMRVDTPIVNNMIEMRTSLKGILPQHIISKWKMNIEKNKLIHDNSDSNTVAFPLPPVISEMIEDFKKALRYVHYIGPLRAPGKRYYMASADDIGFDTVGEFLPYILRDKKDAKVVFCKPGINSDSEISNLATALNTWLYYLRTGDVPDSNVYNIHEINVSTIQNVLVQFTITSVGGAEKYSLADSGFGYSQVLPIIVRGLLAEEGSTLIIEQPELHLNPSLQVRLAEFFISLIKSGRQLLIESHSEHIVNALRVFCAEDNIHNLSEKTKIYFLKNENDSPVVKDMSIQPDGTVPGWPRDFFGESISLSQRLFKAQKNRKK